MKTLRLIENKTGGFDIENFGKSIAGTKGKDPFDIIIQSQDGRIGLRLNHVKMSQLMSPLNLRGSYNRDVYFNKNFIKVERNENSIKLLATNKFVSACRLLQDQGRLLNISILQIVLKGEDGLAYVLASV